MHPIKQAPAQFYRRLEKDKKGRELRALGNPEKATHFELFTDLFIQPESNIQKWITSSCNVLIVPLYGAVELIAPEVNEFIHINQVASFYVKAGSKLTFKNIYPEHTVRFLIIALKSANNTVKRTVTYKFNTLNLLREVYKDPDTGLCLNMGNFEGRKEAMYSLKTATNAIFAYVLQGAFEVNNRLLETGEALCCWNTDRVEVEALSGNAYLLLLEF